VIGDLVMADPKRHSIIQSFTHSIIHS